MSAPRRRQKELCFARRHLKMNEVAYHVYALAVSRESGIFYRDDRRDAKEFLAGKSTICRIAQAVEEKGFMVLLEPRTRLANGQLASGKYKVLTHEEWAAYHPGECRSTVSACPADGTGVDDNQSQNECPPVPFSEVTCPADGTGPVPFSASACPTGGTKNREERIEKKERGEEREETTARKHALAPLRATIVGNVAVDAADPHAPPSFEPSRQWEKNILTGLRETYDRYTHRRFAATKAHEQAVLKLVDDSRADIVLAAFEQWCITSPPEMFTAQVKDDATDEVRAEDIAWPLYNFVNQGHAERHIRAVEPYADLLPCDAETLRLLIEMGGELTGPQIGAVHDLIAAHGYAIVSLAATTAGSISALLQRPRLIEGAKQTHYLFCIANRLDDTVDELGPDVKAAALDLAAAVGWKQALEIIDSSANACACYANFTRFCRAQMAAAAQVA